MSAWPGPMVPQVGYLERDQVDEQLQEQVLAAIGAGDSRQQAELVLEQAHRAMVRRDAYLAGLVRAVQAQDADMVPFLAELYCSYQGFMERDVERAARAVDAVRRQPEQEAER